MTSYYYLEDPESEFGSTPVPEEEMIKALFSIAHKRGLKITDEMILKEVFNSEEENSPKEQTYLFVDGTNFYAAQYELFGPKKYLDFSRFIKEVEKQLKLEFNKIFFYASYSPKPQKPTKKQKKYLKNEALFYRRVRRTKRVVFFKGYRSKTSGKEKEVDVKLAVDIVDFAHRDYFGNIFLLSGDADFMQALFAARRLRKIISVICLENKVMFKSLVFFNTYIIAFKQKPRLKKLSKNIKFIKIPKEPLTLPT